VNWIKRHLAVEFCSSMAFSANRNNDRVGLVIFTDRIEHYLPPKKGRSHIMRLIRDMIYFQPRSKGTDLNCALEFLTHIVKKRCSAFLVSDFLTDENYEENLRLARFRHDLSAVFVTDRREHELPDVGFVKLEDPETGRQFILNTGSAKVRERYRDLALQAHKQTLGVLRRCKVASVRLDTGRSYIQAIVSFFKMRARRRR
jgi:uncharacterized protein (DUF58 family)